MVKAWVYDPFTYRISTFYFNTRVECDEFVKAWNNHMCPIPFNIEEAESFPDLTDGDRRYMNSGKTAEERVCSDLCWGFNVLEHLRIQSPARAFAIQMQKELEREGRLN